MEELVAVVHMEDEDPEQDDPEVNEDYVEWVNDEDEE